MHAQRLLGWWIALLTFAIGALCIMPQLDSLRTSSHGARYTPRVFKIIKPTPTMKEPHVKGMCKAE